MTYYHFKSKRLNVFAAALYYCTSFIVLLWAFYFPGHWLYAKERPGGLVWFFEYTFDDLRLAYLASFSILFSFVFAFILPLSRCLRSSSISVFKSTYFTTKVSFPAGLYALVSGLGGNFYYFVASGTLPFLTSGGVMIAGQIIYIAISLLSLQYSLIYFKKRSFFSIGSILLILLCLGILLCLLYTSRTYFLVTSVAFFLTLFPGLAEFPGKIIMLLRRFRVSKSLLSSLSRYLVFFFVFLYILVSYTLQRASAFFESGQGSTFVELIYERSVESLPQAAEVFYGGICSSLALTRFIDGFSALVPNLLRGYIPVLSTDSYSFQAVSGTSLASISNLTVCFGPYLNFIASISIYLTAFYLVFRIFRFNLFFMARTRFDCDFLVLNGLLGSLLMIVSGETYLWSLPFFGFSIVMPRFAFYFSRLKFS